MEHELAYVSEGRLFLCRPGQAPEPVNSPYAKDIQNRHQEIRRRSEWKNSGVSARASCGGMLFAMDGDRLPVTYVVGAGKSPNGELLYCLQSEDVAGFFSQNIASGEERRLSHGNEFRIESLRYSSLHSSAVGAIGTADGGTSIVIMNPSGGRPQVLTEGDSIDHQPSWVPGASKVLVYQSAGVARSASGFMVGFGPTEILRLNLETSQIESVASDAKYDFLAPRMDESGNLYYIRRPYKLSAGSNLLSVITDIVLFPFRVVRAIVGWLNIFSIIYSGKPLVNDRGVKSRTMDPRQAMICENVVNACNPNGTCEEQGLVPRDWELVRQGPDGSSSVLAKSVACFELGKNSTIYFSNGKTLYRQQGTSLESIASGGGITQILSLD
jgi:hypothetical protein